MNPSETAALGERLEAVRGRLAGAARIAGRKPEDVRLIAVSKLHPVEAILAAYGFGQRVFGENYVQEALAKQEALPDLDVEWHCIGHVQTNKAKDVTGRFALIHTVDNLKFAETLDRRLPEDIPVQRVLLQVNIGNEPQKAGVDEHDLPALAEAVLALPRLEVRGLMCLPPFFDDGEAARPYFARLRELRDDLEARRCWIALFILKADAGRIMVSFAFISIDRLSCIIGSPTMSKHGRTATTPHFSAPYILSLLNTKTPRAAFFIRQPFGPAATNGVTPLVLLL